MTDTVDITILTRNGKLCDFLFVPLAWFKLVTDCLVVDFTSLPALKMVIFWNAWSVIGIPPEPGACCFSVKVIGGDWLGTLGTLPLALVACSWEIFYSCPPWRANLLSR